MQLVENIFDLEFNIEPSLKKKKDNIHSEYICPNTSSIPLSDSSDPKNPIVVFDTLQND